MGGPDTQQRRQAFRRAGIEVDLGDGRIIKVDPIPWEQRNDFGDNIVHQHVQEVNEAVRTYVGDDGIPQLEARFAEKFRDADLLLRSGLTEEAYSLLRGKPLYRNQVIELLLACLEVNEMEHLRPLVDPNSMAPTALSGIVSELMSGLTTLPIESGQDSSSQDSPETPSEP